MERIYKTMRNAGAASVAVGIVILTVGMAAGIVAIVNGAVLLLKTNEIRPGIRRGNPESARPRFFCGWRLKAC